MENASKALIIAAEVLLGVMILSLAVYLFSIFGNYSSETQQRIEETQISQFNNQFLKYYGKINNQTIKCTAHDVISLSNLAKQNNEQYELNLSNYNENSYYIQVKLLGIGQKGKNLEKWTNDEQVDFIRQNATQGTEIKYYKCTNIITSAVTNRVCYMEFSVY